MEVGGFANEGFERVRDTFVANFTERGDVGAAVAVYLDGQPVVDLWGGVARPGEPWQEDTLVGVFSTTKGPTALVVQLLDERGVLDVDQPIVEYWPEFGANGKQDITLADVLSHRSGVLIVPGYRELQMFETEAIVERIEQAEPMWEPGSQHGYHALTFGWIAGEAVRRTAGRSLGTVFADEVAAPLGLEFWIGLPEALDARVAGFIDAPPPDDDTVAAYLAMFTPDTWTGQAHYVGESGLLEVADGANSAEMRRAEIPAAGGIGTMRSLARMYGALAVGGTLDGIEIVSPQSIEKFTAEQVHGFDTVHMLESRYGLGYARPTDLFPMGPNDEAFGHGGLGGSLAFADPAARVGFAYAPNQLLFPNLNEGTRSRALADAVYDCL